MSQPATLPERPPAAVWRWGVVLVLLAWTLQAYALWSRTYVPLVDLPNHMARHYLEYLQLSGRELPASYVIDYRVLPNLGADLTLPPLLFVFDPLTACKVFLTLAVFLYWLGPALFILQCGNYRPGAFVAALLLLPLSFSPQFFWGFLNYYSGVGLAFLALVHFGRLCRLERPHAIELTAHALFVTLLFLWHLAAWGIYGVLMGCRLLVLLVRQYRGDGRLGPCVARAVRLVLPALPGLALMAVYRASQAQAGPANDWGGWVRKLVSPLTLFRAYDWRTDAVVVALWGLAAACLFGPLVWRRILPSLARRANRSSLTLRVGARLEGGAPLLGFLVLGVLYLVIPYQLGSTSDTDTRLLPALLVCALALLGSLPMRRLAPGLGLLAVCLLVRFGAVVYAWDRFAPRLDAHARAFAALEPGGRVLPVVLVPEDSKDYPEKHFLAWAVVSRHIFDPTLFALPDQHTLRITAPRPRCLTVKQGVCEVAETPTRACYDCVWVDNPANRAVRLPPGCDRIFANVPVDPRRVRAGP